MSNNSNNTQATVEVYKRLNKLKLKAGVPLSEDVEGYIDPAALRRAKDNIDEEIHAYNGEIEDVLKALNRSWKNVVSSTDEQRAAHLDKLYNYANNIKDLAETYHYRLMSYFGLSLRDFCEKIDTTNKNHHVIVQAHIDVMWATFEQNIKSDGGETAQELKDALNIAIKQNS